MRRGDEGCSLSVLPPKFLLGRSAVLQNAFPSPRNHLGGAGRTESNAITKVSTSGVIVYNKRERRGREPTESNLFRAAQGLAMASG